MSRKRMGQVVVAVLALIVLVVLGFLLWPKSSPKVVIPASISQGYSFQPLVASSSNAAQVSEVSKTIKYDTQEKVFSFVTLVDTKQVTITEQAYPEVLVFDSVINGFNVYSTLDSKIGKVYLGHPNNASGGGQAAVARTDTLLIFGKPNQDLTINEWYQVFNSLSLPAQ